MLTRNCETKQTPLIYPGDFNVRVTVFDKNPKYYVPEVYFNAWFETIMDSIGGSILHSDDFKTFSIKRIDRRQPYLVRRTGKELAKSLRFLFHKPVSFRIETVEDNPRVWIFLMEKDI